MKSSVWINIQKLGCGLIALCLASCATVPTQTTYIPWHTRAQNLQALQTWNVSGSFSLATPQQAVFATYDWKQNHADYDIHLESTLDVVSAELIGSSAFVELKQGNKPTQTADSPEQLVQQTLGWQLPVTPLQYWIRGLPAPGMPMQITLDAFGRLQRFDQAGWEVGVLRYVSVEGRDLPAMLYLQRPGLKIKITLHWSV